uniref:Uncharacterized protein LOC101514297 n=1 Tax=Cicer arietinum TaxID=3827 RepID=A0A1S2XFU0_CICAR|nr:uncharacterized protein LOC101514297 [Cicer arietinum]
MKNVSKNKFLTCFRPVFDFEAQNSATESKFSEQNCSKSKLNEVACQPPKQTLAKNTRAHKKNRYQNCFGSKRSYFIHTKSSCSSTFNSTNIEEIKAIESSWSCSSSSSSPISESKSLSLSKSSEGQLEKEKKFKCIGLYMVVLICLVVTVFWGKINVIILTSMSFCCFSLCNASSHLLKRVAKLSNTKSHRDHIVKLYI